MLDRKIPPQIHTVTRVEIPEVEKYFLDNGVPVVEINQGTQEIIRLEVIYDASRPIEDKQLASRMTAALQKEGTASYSSEVLAEKIDYYGASMSSGSNLDFSYFSIFVLSKYFSDLMPLLAEVLELPIFDQSELDKHKEIQLEKLKSNLAKTDLLAYRKVTEEIFGADHVYGYNSSSDNIKSITRQDLVNHHKNYHTSDRCHIVISGKLPRNIKSILNQHLGQVKTKSVSKKYIQTNVPLHRQIHQIHADQTHQTAIKIGRRMFNRKHKDFAHSFMLNTILGGYFGSRLMESIREDLGYTYNIYSSLDPLVHDGYMTISTEVSNDLVQPTLNEIYMQMEKLQNDRISDAELNMVRNYIMGNFLNMVDGPFRIASLMKTLTISDMDIKSYSQIIDQIYNCTPEQIQDQAQKYLGKNDLIEVLVGSKY